MAYMQDNAGAGIDAVSRSDSALLILIYRDERIGVDARGNGHCRDTHGDEIVPNRGALSHEDIRTQPGDEQPADSAVGTGLQRDQHLTSGGRVTTQSPGS